MRTVYKYQTGTVGGRTELPTGAKILTAQIQHGNLCIWALVETEETRLEWWEFRVFGTGHDLGEMFSGDYIATFQLFERRDVAFVGHVFGERL